MAAAGIIVTISIASAIAKHIAKKWIGSDLLDHFAEELIDLVKGKGEQTVEQRRQEREVDKLATAMTSRMRLVYEPSKLPDHSKQAVAAEVALTLSKFNINVERVVAHRLDAEKLTELMLNTRPDAMKLFSADETALYERLISEAAFAQVQISGLLEGFTGAFAAKLLKDHEILLSLVEKLLREPDEVAKQFQQRYKECVRNKLDRLEVFGLPKLDRYSRQQSLSVAYISLDAEPRSLDVITTRTAYERFEETAPSFKLNSDVLSIAWEWIDENRARKDIFERLSNRPLVMTLDSGELSEFAVIWHSIVSRPNSIESILASKRRIVVQGQAGSGKTTLLHWLAVRAASGDFEPPLSSWNQAIPFFIRLREYVDKGFPAPQEFLEKIAPMIIGHMPAGWVHHVLDSGLGLVLVDGVDELPLDQRNDMLVRLADLVATYPASRYVVSSRPAALKEQLWPQWKEWVEAEGFSTTTLRDMDGILVATFIDQWHTALAASTKDAEEQRNIRTHAASLKSLLNGRPPLRRLAKNPLLCAMICALYQERLQNLPSERLKLYEECVELLLTRRDEGRRVLTNYDYPPLTLSQRLALIQDLSYWIIINGYSDLEVQLADKRFEWKLPALGLTDITGERVRHLFVDRTNLLRDPVVDRIDFTHLTFQEYLAAREAHDLCSFRLIH